MAVDVISSVGTRNKLVYVVIIMSQQLPEMNLLFSEQKDPDITAFGIFFHV